jgi:heme exporter protein A
MLTCDNIAYKTRFSGLGFSLTPGALLAVYGADATGLIMLLANKLQPSQGIITFEEQPIKRNREYANLSLHIHTDIRFRLWEGVEKAVLRLARSGGGAPELVEAALRYWGLTEHRNAQCSTLPLALQKRIMLTQLLTLPRPIWLLDHPELGLDTEGLGMLDALMANRCNQDGIVIIATGREGFMTPLPCIRMDDFKQR